MTQRWFTPGHFTMALAAFAGVMLTAWITVGGGLGPVAVPGQTPEQAMALVQGKLAGVLYQGMVSLPALVMFWTAALGLGWWVQEKWLADHRARRVLRLGIGMALMLLLAMFLGWGGLLNRWTAWFLCAPGVWLAGWKIADRQRRRVLDIEGWPNPPWTVVLCLVPGTLLLIAAICPPGTLWAVEAFGYDTLAYHLQLPKEWIALGRITPLAHNVYSYLPNLVEAGYTQLLLMQGGGLGGIYIAQLWHVTTALVAAALVAHIVSRWTGPAAGGLAAACFLLSPWVLITGSCAYNEMAALTLVGSAMLILFEEDDRSMVACGIAGSLLGIATLAKLTIGLLCVLPLALLALWRLHDPPSARPRLGQGSLILLLAGALTLSPWLLRNALHTGNPVFPFATAVLGTGPWQDWQVEGWKRASTAEDRFAGAWGRLRSRWLTSPGYGAVGGGPAASANGGLSEAAGFDITGFHRQGGLPLLWMVTAGAALVAWRWPAAGRLTLAMLFMLAAQLILWICFTHQQARFLLPTLLPACILLGLGHERCRQLLRGRGKILSVVPAVGAALVAAALTWNQWDLLRHQTRRLPWDQKKIHEPLYRLVDSLPTQPMPELLLAVGAVAGDHVLNYLPADSRILLVADAAVLYLRGQVIYNSAFDRSLLGDALRQAGPAPAPVNTLLKQIGCTHVWVNWAELERLIATYGYDPALTPEEVRRLAESWRLAADYGWASLYVLP